MRKLYNHSKSTLFLMEMILSILILSLTCTACVQIFAAARNNREKARQYNHIQELDCLCRRGSGRMGRPE